MMTLGIVELGGGSEEEDDEEFYVAAAAAAATGSNSSSSGSRSQGAQNNKIYTVSMRPFRAFPDGTVITPPLIREVGRIPSAVALNGMTRLQRSDRFVLIADSGLGGVWKLDVDSGDSKVVVQDASMRGPVGKSSFAGLGINGVRGRDGMLFYTNSGVQEMWKMDVSDDFRFLFFFLSSSFSGGAHLIFRDSINRHQNIR